MDNRLQQSFNRAINEAVRRGKQEMDRLRLTGNTPVVPALGGTVTGKAMVWGVDGWGVKRWGSE